MLIAKHPQFTANARLLALKRLELGSLSYDQGQEFDAQILFNLGGCAKVRLKNDVEVDLNDERILNADFRVIHEIPARGVAPVVNPDWLLKPKYWRRSADN